MVLLVKSFRREVINFSFFVRSHKTLKIYQMFYDPISQWVDVNTS